MVLGVNPAAPVGRVGEAERHECRSTRWPSPDGTTPTSSRPPSSYTTCGDVTYTVVRGAHLLGDVRGRTAGQHRCTINRRLCGEKRARGSTTVVRSDTRTSGGGVASTPPPHRRSSSSINYQSGVSPTSRVSTLVTRVASSQDFPAILGMARRGRPLSGLTLSEVERETLARWARRPKTHSPWRCGVGSCWPRRRG